MTKVKIPTVFRAHTRGDRESEFGADTVGDLLDALTERYPDLRSHLLNDQGQLLSFVNVFVNDQNIRDLSGSATPLSGRDEVFLVPAMAGG